MLILMEMVKSIMLNTKSYVVVIENNFDKENYSFILKQLKITYTVNIYRHVIGKNNVIGVNR